MAKTYEVADKDAHDILGVLMEHHHDTLHDHELQIAIVGVKETGDGYALSKDSLRVLAQVRKQNDLQRLLTGFDAVIEIDVVAYGKMDPCVRAALLDHELCHLAVVLDRYGNLKQNDDGRPKLAMVPHDAQIGVFQQCMRRHKYNAIETIVMRAVIQCGHQQLFEFAVLETESEDPAVEAEEAEMVAHG